MLLRAGSLICRAATHAGRRAQYSRSSSGSKCCSNGSIRFMSSTAPFGGDLSDLLSFGADGKITSTTATTRKTEFDMVVVGGGSGGIACARAAAEQGGSVCLLDYVEPSTQGTTWGLGGTCVNVGCIPKKIMHQAALMKHNISDAQALGWTLATDSPSHDWETLRKLVHQYIASLNFGYVSTLQKEGVEYHNARGRLTSPHTVECTSPSGETFEVKGSNIVVAVGTRPLLPDVPGMKEYCITSDDLFSHNLKPGGSVCVIGASYVALECAGFLTELGYDTTVMVRSKLLRGFDEQMAEKIGEHMVGAGTGFMYGHVPVSVVKDDTDGRLHVTSRGADGQQHTTVADHVLVATGRQAATHNLGLADLGVELSGAGKIVAPATGVHSETSTVASIHAVGDVLHARPELTPVAIQAGKLLADRLLAVSSKAMDYDTVPTTVFTPLEYSCIGWTEEDAIAAHGEDNIEVYHSIHQPLEMAAIQASSLKPPVECYMKLVCERGRQGRVLGMHILGPSAGEVAQGFAVAIRLGATKDDFDSTVGIHPTHAEEALLLTRTKRSGVSPVKTSC